MSAETKGAILSAVDAHTDAEVAEALAEQEEQHATELAAANARATQAEQALTVLRAEYDAHMATHQPEVPEEPPAPAASTRIGMNAMSMWDQRLREVGPDGITARRIFIDDINDTRQKSSQIDAAIRAGMMPILSYKGTPTASNVAALRTYLTSLGVPVTATYHHEPRGDMTPEQFRARSKAFLGVQAPNVLVGPLLNGWLLTSNLAEFSTWSDTELLDRWDFMGLDTYETMGKIPGDRIPPLLSWLTERGHPDKPIVVGEYNGHTAKSIADSGEMFLSTPNVIVACIWNATGSGSAEATPLEGDRLAAFKATKADPRVKK